jgi:predicted GIY-YIG superfamily endonuclease
MSYWVYMLRCSDGSIYTGTAVDVDRRFATHCAGKGAKYTRSHPPVEIIYREALPDRSAALRREAAIKQLPHAQKAQLAALSPSSDVPSLSI